MEKNRMAKNIVVGAAVLASVTLFSQFSFAGSSCCPMSSAKKAAEYAAKGGDCSGKKACSVSADVAGVYSNSSGTSLLTIMADGKFILTDSKGLLLEKGSFAVEKDEFVIKSADQEARLAMKASPEDLHLTERSADDKGISKALAGKWTYKSEAAAWKEGHG